MIDPVKPLSPREFYHLARRESVVRESVSVGAGARREYRTHPIMDARDIRAAVLHALGARGMLRGERRMLVAACDAVSRIRRSAAHAAYTRRPTLIESEREYFAHKIRAEAERRQLPTVLDLARNGSMPLGVCDELREGAIRTVLLRAEGFARYSRRVRDARKSLSILGGRDDAGLWAVRVPGTCNTVRDALDWLAPARVKHAREDGRAVLRQGDVWIVESSRDQMGAARLPRNHTWDATARVLHHGAHTALAVPFPAVAIPQRTLSAWGSERRAAD